MSIAASHPSSLEPLGRRSVLFGTLPELPNELREDQ